MAHSDSKQRKKHHGMPQLTDDTLLRLPQVLQLIPVARSTWWDGVKDGLYPKPVRISARAVAWRVRDLRGFIEGANYCPGTSAKVAI